MAKDVFLKVYIPEGQRHCVMDDSTFKKKRPGYLLFADKCLTPILEKDAEALVRQNPHLCSFEPMTEKEIKKAKKGYPREEYPPDHKSKKILEHDLETDHETTMEMAAEDTAGAEPKTITKTLTVELTEPDITGEVKSVLETLAKMSDEEYKKMPVKEIIGHGNTLGVKLPVTMKKVEQLKILNDRASYLMEKVKSDEEDYQADD